jgi:probable phosphoglycerate mutase
MNDSQTHILLIRHGMNDLLVEHRLGGRLPGIHLNAEGQAQAQALGARLANVPLAAVYSSPMERAIETAEPLTAIHGLPLVKMDGLYETDCGEWAGQPVEEVNKHELWRQIQFYASGVRFPGGESVVEVQARMVATLEALRAAHPGQTIVAVSHSDPIKTALVHYLGMPLDLFQRLVINPASVTELVFTPTGPRMVRYNDCAHYGTLR